MEKDKQEHRARIAAACAARTFLYFNDFLSEAESNRVHARIKKYQDKYQDKYRVNISRDQVNSVTLECSGD